MDYTRQAKEVLKIAEKSAKEMADDGQKETGIQSETGIHSGRQ